MIKANELRRGSVIHAVRNGQAYAHCRVLTICQDFCEVDYQVRSLFAAPNNPGIGMLKYAEADPIPLTEEWLVKLGFEDKGEGVFEQNSIEVYLDNADAWLYLSQGNGGYEIGEPFQSIHQLQNLYFALTGEELTNKRVP